MNLVNIQHRNISPEYKNIYFTKRLHCHIAFYNNYFMIHYHLFVVSNINILGEQILITLRVYCVDSRLLSIY